MDEMAQPIHYGLLPRQRNFRRQGLPFDLQPGTNRLYVQFVHLSVPHLPLDGFANKAEYAQLLNAASEVQFHHPARDTREIVVSK